MFCSIGFKPEVLFFSKPGSDCCTCGHSQQDLELYVVLLWPQNPRSFCRMQIHPDHYLFVLSISLVGVTADRRNLRKGGERRRERRRRRKKKDLAQKKGIMKLHSYYGKYCESHKTVRKWWKECTALYSICWGPATLFLHPVCLQRLQFVIHSWRAIANCHPPTRIYELCLCAHMISPPSSSPF